ncbi:MAG: BrnA antitoxin family protein [Candidatus Puniceispirillales bacterium]
MTKKSYIDDNGEVMELDEQWFKEASFGRPPLPPEERKERITIRLDKDIVEDYRATGKGWQSRLNADLRKVKETG